jgi:hypothetical protein
MQDTLARPAPGGVDDELNQTIKKFVNGLPDDATEFINNVLLHPNLRYPIDSKEKLEELGAQAKFRDRCGLSFRLALVWVLPRQARCARSCRPMSLKICFRPFPRPGEETGNIFGHGTPMELGYEKNRSSPHSSNR